MNPFKASEEAIEKITEVIVLDKLSLNSIIGRFDAYSPEERLAYLNELKNGLERMITSLNPLATKIRAKYSGYPKKSIGEGRRMQSNYFTAFEAVQEAIEEGKNKGKKMNAPQWVIWLLYQQKAGQIEWFENDPLGKTKALLVKAKELGFNGQHFRQTYTNLEKDENRLIPTREKDFEIVVPHLQGDAKDLALHDLERIKRNM